MPVSRATVILLPPEIDIANAEQVAADLLMAIDQGYAVVVADMSRTSFCDCAGVAALLSAGSYAANLGAQLRIAARAKSVLRMFELTGLRLAMPVYRSSLAALHEPTAATSWQCRPPADGTSPVASAPGTVSCLRRIDGAESAPQPDPRRCP